MTAAYDKMRFVSQAPVAGRAKAAFSTDPLRTGAVLSTALAFCFPEGRFPDSIVEELRFKRDFFFPPPLPLKCMFLSHLYA